VIVSLTHTRTYLHLCKPHQLQQYVQTCTVHVIGLTVCANMYSACNWFNILDIYVNERNELIVRVNASYVESW